MKKLLNNIEAVKNQELSDMSEYYKNQILRLDREFLINGSKNRLLYVEKSDSILKKLILVAKEMQKRNL